MKKKFTHYLPYCGVMAAATFIFTSINITIQLGGKGSLVHFGGVMAVIIAFILPPLYGATSAALGMATYDVLTAPFWAPFTLVIRFLQVFILSYFINKSPKKSLYMIIGFILAFIIDVSGYYFAEVIITGNWISPLVNVPVEIIFNILSIAVGLPALMLLKKSKITQLLK